MTSADVTIHAVARVLHGLDRDRHEVENRPRSAHLVSNCFEQILPHSSIHICLTCVWHIYYSRQRPYFLLRKPFEANFSTPFSNRLTVQEQATNITSSHTPRWYQAVVRLHKNVNTVQNSHAYDMSTYAVSMRQASLGILTH